MMLRRYLIAFIFGLTSLVASAQPVAVRAADDGIARSSFSIVPWQCTLKPGGCSVCDIGYLIINASNLIAGLISGVSLIMFLVAGFYFVFSNGNEERVTLAKKIITGVIMGLGMVFAGWFVINAIVRLSYSASTGKTASTTGDYKLFGTTNWWAALDKCSPDTTDCVGKKVGDACGTVGDCSNTSAGACYCYRQTNPDEDKVDAQNCRINSSSSNPEYSVDEACWCTAGCTLYNEIKPAEFSDYTFTCQTQPTSEEIEEGAVDATTKFGVSCSQKNLYCVGNKK